MRANVFWWHREPMPCHMGVALTISAEPLQLANIELFFESSSTGLYLTIVHIVQTHCEPIYEIKRTSKSNISWILEVI